MTAGFVFFDALLAASTTPVRIFVSGSTRCKFRRPTETALEKLVIEY